MRGSASQETGPLELVPTAFGLPRQAGTVTILQTHIGWVYLVGKYAFKLKKHVKYDFLDFTTLEQRRWACQREVELNRRLAPGLYLGVLPVVRAKGGKLRIVLPKRGSGAARSADIVDWAVWMNRLPAERMLDRLLENNAVAAADIAEISAVLSQFYVNERGRVAPGGLGDLEFVTFNVNENIREGWRLDRQVLPDGALRLIEKRARHFLHKYGGLVHQRARDGFVVDGHGDLRAENICLPEGSPPALFDCIEFNDRFRVCDSALDIAYLAMDLDSRGRTDLSQALVEHYVAACDPDLPPKLFNFYLGYRAFVKAKVAAWIMADPAVGATQRQACARQAKDLFDLSVRYALRDEPVLIVFCGPAGSGKSTLAAELARRLGAMHLATDRIRDEIVPRGLPAEQRYAPTFSFRVYQELLARSAKALAEKRVVILDATFTSSSTRARAAELAQNATVPSVLVWADCPATANAKHLSERADGSFGSEATLAVAEKQRVGFERPKLKEAFGAICRIDTSAPLDRAHAQVWQDVLAALAEQV